MCQKDFRADGNLLSQLMVKDLQEVSQEEAQGAQVCNRWVLQLMKHTHGTSSHIMGTDSS